MTWQNLFKQAGLDHKWKSTIDLNPRPTKASQAKNADAAVKLPVVNAVDLYNAVIRAGGWQVRNMRRLLVFNILLGS